MKSIVQVVPLIQQVINVVVWSPCGKFLAAGTVGGTLSVWDVEAKLCIERYSAVNMANTSVMQFHAEELLTHFLLHTVIKCIITYHSYLLVYMQYVVTTCCSALWEDFIKALDVHCCTYRHET